MDGGWAGSNLSISKEAKKLYGPVHFFLGVGVHLLIPMETYTSYDFSCQESLSLSSPPLWMILFCGYSLAVTSIGLGWFMFFILSQEHPTARLNWH